MGIRRMSDLEGNSNEDNFYSKEGREILVEGGALRNEEDAFMAGYEEWEMEEMEEDEELDEWSESTRVEEET